jgi:hypothetical protein
MTDSDMPECFEALLDYGQADMEGVIVTTSRQAIHECADLYAALEAERDRLRKLVWLAWKEMNAIRAMSGVPLDFHGGKQGIDEGYWSSLVDEMDAALGDDAKPWPYFDARAALAQGEG